MLLERVGNAGVERFDGLRKLVDDGDLLWRVAEVLRCHVMELSDEQNGLDGALVVLILH